MIYDRIEQLSAWAERCPDLRRALLAAAEQAAAPFAPGIAPIDGDALYASASAYPTKARGPMFENHRHHIDVQLLIRGEEQIDVCLPRTPLPEREYQAEGDFELLPLEEAYTTVTLRAGEFLLLFPGEWHRPGISAGGSPAECEKIVVKIDTEQNAHI